MLEAMREVMRAIERSGHAWYVTGSEALAAYGTPRQTMDVDIVIEATPTAIAALASGLERDHYFAEPLRIGNRQMASLVHRSGGGKVDLIIRDPDPWGRSAMERRRQWEHPTWGATWVSSLEDLILAKLEWSEGTSELHLRDARTLVRMNERSIDHAYLSRWAAVLGVESLLQAIDG